MIKPFSNPGTALEFTCDFNTAKDGSVMAIQCPGISIWTRDDQKLLFPVLLMRRISPLDCFDLFASDLELEEESLNQLRSFLASIHAEFDTFEIVGVDKWMIDFRIRNLSKQNSSAILDRSKQMNAVLVTLARERWGRMSPGPVQPSPLHRRLGLFRVGLM